MKWIVANDAGGAELISSWVKAHPAPYEFVLEGPALAVFSRKLQFRNRNRTEFSSELRAGDEVITGTGWSSDLEKWARAKAKEAQIRCISFLDHWSNYAMRFEWSGSICLPDEIWVADQYAHALAKREFPKTPIIELPNDYLQQCSEEIRALENFSPITPTSNAIRILYVCEAIQERTGAQAPGEGPEFESFERFFQWLDKQPAAHYLIRLRLHPAEKIGKYNVLLQKYPALSLEISSQTTLAQDCAWSAWVIGMSSMALVVALAAGKRTFSCMPRADQSCPLPYKEIQSI